MDHRAAPTVTPKTPVRDALSALLPRLHARALRLSRSRAEADDLVQEMCLRALRFESTFAAGTNVRAWLHQILESVFISRCRSRSRERRALGRFSGDPTLGGGVAPAPEVQAVTSHVHRAPVGCRARRPPRALLPRGRE